MKTKRFLVVCLIAGISIIQLSGQTLKKGAVLAASTYYLTLNPDVTMNQFVDFWVNKYNPAFEKSFPDIKAFVLVGDRGEKKNQVGFIWYFESAAVRDKYFPKEDDKNMSDAFKAGSEKMKDLDAELGKLVVDAKREYTDWIIK